MKFRSVKVIEDKDVLEWTGRNGFWISGGIYGILHFDDMRCVSDEQVEHECPELVALYPHLFSDDDIEGK